MIERVLAEGPGKVVLVRGGDSAALSVTDGETIVFPVETASLLGVLEDVPIQLSRCDGHCRLEVIGGRIRIEFLFERGGRGSCAIEAEAFRAAICQPVDS